jgi:hypothetical protein
LAPAFWRGLLFLGERIEEGAAFWREAARVARVVVGLAGAGAFCAPRTRFLGTSSAFSLSSLDSSSLLRFLVRVVAGLTAVFVVVFAAGAVFVVMAAAAGAARVFLVAGAGAGAGAGVVADAARSLRITDEVVAA